MEEDKCMAKKTYNEQLNAPRDLPEIKDLSDKPEAAKRFGGVKLLLPAPMQYNNLMEKIPEGKIITTGKIREHLAAEAGADATCPLVTGIFVNICAHASEERDADKIPWWRTLKKDGELNEKFPDGIDGQKLRLELEGHTVVQKGKRWFVEGYEDKQHPLSVGGTPDE